MAPTASSDFSLFDEDFSGEDVSVGGLSGDSLEGGQDWEASSSSGGRLSAEEESSAFSICGQGAYAEEELDDCDSLANSTENANGKRVRQDEREERSNFGPKLDVGMWGTLDDHLLEKIMARLPFKSLFQAATLSKAWRHKIQSPSFQTEVLSRSSASSWKSYAPLFVNDKADLLGYESGSNRWHRLPTHSYLSEEMIKKWTLVAVTGTLFCWTCRADPDDFFRGDRHIHVTNPVTESWKRLPPRPIMDLPEIVQLGLDGYEAYKVILGNLTALQNQRRVLIGLQVFQSTDNSWTMESYTNTQANCGDHCAGSAFVNGVLYVLVFTLEGRSGYTLISYNVKEKVWKEIPYLCEVSVEKPNLRLRYWDVRFSQLFICGSNVMLVVIHVDSVPNPEFDAEEDSSDNEELYDIVLSVFKLDLEHGLAYELSRAGNDMVSPGLAMGMGNAAAQGDCIYVGGGHISCSSIVFNVNTLEWDSINPATVGGLLHFSRRSSMTRWKWMPFAYQPGLNLFLEV